MKANAKILKLVVLSYVLSVILFNIPISIFAAEQNDVSAQIADVQGTLSTQSSGSVSSTSSENNASSSQSQSAQNSSVYIANYNVIDSLGNEIYQVYPTDKIWIAVTVVDERQKINDITQITSENIGSFVQSRIVTGAFSPVSAGDVSFNLRAPVKGCLSYTILFKDTVYQGNEPQFAFDIIQLDGNNQSSLPVVTLRQNIAQCKNQTIENGNIIPKSMVASVKTATISEPFSISGVISNTGKLPIKDLVSTVSTDAAFVLTTNSNTKYSGDFPEKTDKTVSFNFTVSPAADPGVHSIKITHTGTTDGKTVTCTQEITVIVNALERFEVSNVQLPDKFVESIEDFVKITFINMGKSSIYNVSVSVKTDNSTKEIQTKYIGNIEAGTESSAEFSLVPKEKGTVHGDVTVQYEDAAGIIQTKEEHFEQVVEKSQTNAGADLAGMVPEANENDKEPNVWMFIAIAVFLLMLSLIIFQYTRNKRREMKILMEDREEDHENI